MLGIVIAHMKYYTRKLEALRFIITLAQQIPPRQPLYMLHPDQGPNQVLAEEADLLLLENARIVHVHYGHAEINQPRTHVYIIPVHVRAIRAKAMELLREPASANPEEIRHPLASQLEQALMTKLQGTSLA